MQILLRCQNIGLSLRYQYKNSKNLMAKIMLINMIGANVFVFMGRLTTAGLGCYRVEDRVWCFLVFALIGQIAGLLFNASYFRKRKGL